MKQLYILIFCFFSFHSTSQNSLILTNANPIDPYRYKNIKGSPYLFDDFTLGEIQDQGGEKYQDVLINYNASEDLIEVRKGNKFIELAQRSFKIFNTTDKKN